MDNVPAKTETKPVKQKEQISKLQKIHNILAMLINFIVMGLFIAFTTLSLTKKWGDTILIKIIYVFLIVYVLVYIGLFISMFVGGKTAKENNVAVKNMKAVMKIFKKVLVILNLVIASLIAVEGANGTPLEKIFSFAVMGFTISTAVVMIAFEIIKIKKRNKKLNESKK